MPWGMIEQAIRLVILILEGVPLEQRQATAVALFWGMWPLMKLNPEVAKREKEILAMMDQIGKPPTQ